MLTWHMKSAIIEKLTRFHKKMSHFAELGNICRFFSFVDDNSEHIDCVYKDLVSQRIRRR